MSQDENEPKPKTELDAPKAARRFPVDHAEIQSRFGRWRHEMRQRQLQPERDLSGPDDPKAQAALARRKRDHATDRSAGE